jgi:hypothetical protein
MGLGRGVSPYFQGADSSKIIEIADSKMYAGKNRYMAPAAS